MKLLVDCSMGSGTRIAAAPLIGGQLLTPLTRYSRWSETWAVDNGAFSGFDPKKFAALLARQSDLSGCLWVVAPDVVGSARRTLELFWRRRTWIPKRFPVALAAQDGIEDLDLPWDQFRCLFIGGSTDFKYSKTVRDLIVVAKILGKLVHAGRVNTPGRWDYFESLGVDTCDGSGLSRYDHMSEKIIAAKQAPTLFGDEQVTA